MFTEEGIIELFFPPGRLPLDDCAFLRESGLVVSGDTMAEGTHFKREWHSPERLARKLLHGNLSDLAAGGADPAWCLLQLGIPPDLDEAFLRVFASAFRDECSRASCDLIGGDTYRSGIMTLSLTVAGKAVRPLGRRAAVGDALYLTGDVGLSLAGLKHLQGTHPLMGELRDRALEKHLAPTARLAWASKIRERRELHGMMDLSDGIAQDTVRFARAAGLSMTILLDRLPVPEELGMPPQEAACSGEEYELFFAAPPGWTFPFPATEIGYVEGLSPNPVRFMLRGQPVELKDPGFRHFR